MVDYSSSGDTCESTCEMYKVFLVSTEYETNAIIHNQIKTGCILFSH